MTSDVRFDTGSIWNATFETIGRPLVVAHRGGMAIAPANTRLAFETASRLGVDAVEADLRLTADGVVVCMHDADIADEAGSMRAIGQLSHAELLAREPQALSFEALYGVHQTIFLDLKEPDLDGQLALLETIDASNRAPWLLASVTDLTASAAIAERFPRLRQVSLMRSHADIAKFVRNRPGDWVRLHQWTASPRQVEALKRDGARVIVTCGSSAGNGGDVDAAGLPELLALAPDAIVINDPRLATTLAGTRT